MINQLHLQLTQRRLTPFNPISTICFSLERQIP